ncbi:hypothetical protein DFP73DRAFT_525049 [Morchella snyderi]|nr:hypothetical protein DFP73DRAFT_525049 [Morchella snyderi]
MLGLMLMQLVTPPSLPTLPSLTWSVTTYTATASPHHHTFTAWDFTLPTPPLSLLLLLLALLCYALHRHEDRQRRATYEGIFLHPTVPNAKVHIATTTSAADAGDDKQSSKNWDGEKAPSLASGTRHEWRFDDYSCGYTRCTTTSFAAATPLYQSQQQSEPRLRPLPQPSTHSPTQIKSVEWCGSYRETVQTYTRPSVPAGSIYVAQPIFPRAPAPAVRPPPARALPPAPVLALASTPQHSSLPLPPADTRYHSHLLIQPRTPHSSYNHPVGHATPPTRPTRTVFSHNYNTRPRAYPPPLYRAATTTTSAIRQLGRSAISKPPAIAKLSKTAAIVNYRASVYPRRDPSPDEDEKEESGTDAMDIDLPTPPSTPPPAIEVTPPAWSASSLGSDARPSRPRTRSTKPRLRASKRAHKKEPLRRTLGGRIVKSRDGEGRDWVLGFPEPRGYVKPQRGKKKAWVQAQEQPKPVTYVRVAALRAEARGERAVGGRWRWRMVAVGA